MLTAYHIFFLPDFSLGVFYADNQCSVDPPSIGPISKSLNCLTQLHFSQLAKNELEAPLSSYFVMRNQITSLKTKSLEDKFAFGLVSEDYSDPELSDFIKIISNNTNKI